MTDQTPMNEMDAAPEGLDPEHRDMALSRAHHCVDAALEELRQVATGESLTAERAFLMTIALESAGDVLEDVLSGLYG